MAQYKFLLVLKDLADNVFYCSHKLRSRRHAKGRLVLGISDFSDEWNKTALEMAQRDRTNAVGCWSASSPVSVADQGVSEGDMLLNVSDFTDSWNKQALANVRKRAK